MHSKLNTKFTFKINGQAPQNASGFTLIEISIVLIIIGFMMSGILATLRASKIGLDDRVTKENIEKAEAALKSYFAMNGAFPCPASRIDKKGMPDFGKAVNNCITKTDSISTRSSVNRKTVSAIGREERRVSIGILPFRSLGIADNDGLDGYGNLLQYAVTEVLTQPALYNQKNGAIDVVAEDGQSRVTPPGSVQYVVYSSGADRRGGYTAQGEPTDQKCPVKTLQKENCNDDAIFMEAEITYAPKTEDGLNVLYDDRLAYFQHEVPIAVNGGMVLPYVSSCPRNFKQVEADGLKIIDGDPLTLNPKLGQKSGAGIFSKVVFCHTSTYSITITIVQDEIKALSQCPEDWQHIGYKAINPFSSKDNEFYHKVCAR